MDFIRGAKISWDIYFLMLEFSYDILGIIMQANMIKKQIENINDLQDVKLENVQFIRTGASEETLSFYALDDKEIIYLQL